MKTKIMSIFTRTPLHVGCGSSVGAVDQPVVRERHTGYPVIPGSTIKGVLADLWRTEGTDVKVIEKKDNDGNIKSKNFVRIDGGDAQKLFGDNSEKNGNAASGNLLIGEGKLLVFPVRSARGGYALVTCPFALSRFKRDCAKAKDMPIPECNDDSKVIVSSKSVLLFQTEQTVLLESYVFDAEKATADADAVAKELLDLMPTDYVWQDIVKRLAIVSDTTFKRCVMDTCEIAQHNRINDFTGVVDDGALFNQENVPSETMFYSVFNELKDGCIKSVEDRLKSDKVNELLQIGADITTGLGWCSVGFCGKEA